MLPAHNTTVSVVWEERNALFFSSMAVENVFLGLMPFDS